MYKKHQPAYRFQAVYLDPSLILRFWAKFYQSEREIVGEAVNIQFLSLTRAVIGKMPSFQRTTMDSIKINDQKDHRQVYQSHNWSEELYRVISWEGLWGCLPGAHHPCTVQYLYADYYRVHAPEKPIIFTERYTQEKSETLLTLTISGVSHRQRVSTRLGLYVVHLLHSNTPEQARVIIQKTKTKSKEADQVVYDDWRDILLIDMAGETFYLRQITVEQSPRVWQTTGVVTGEARGFFRTMGPTWHRVGLESARRLVLFSRACWDLSAISVGRQHHCGCTCTTYVFCTERTEYCTLWWWDRA